MKKTWKNHWHHILKILGCLESMLNLNTELITWKFETFLSQDNKAILALPCVTANSLLLLKQVKKWEIKAWVALIAPERFMELWSKFSQLHQISFETFW